LPFFYLHMIQISQVDFSYFSSQEPPLSVFTGLNLNISQGRYVAIMGPNGSGKSTLGKLIKGILTPTSGAISIHGTRLKTGEVSQRVGYIFSNPDNQIVSSVVEEDVAFGLENAGMDPADISARVQESLRMVGMEAYRESPPHLLSGGQQQKIVLAGVLAMESDILVLDEPTSMLDYQSREEILGIFQKIHLQQNKTILHLTHSLEEALQAQDVLFLRNGQILFHGTWEDFLTHEPKLIFSLGPFPQIFKLIQGLRDLGYCISPKVRTKEDLKKFLMQYPSSEIP
jgi:energy-coupling factor transport system ATP-binding protein